MKISPWSYPILLSQSREGLYKAVEEKVGNTPLYKIHGLTVPNANQIFAKEEFLNPTSSNFDRVYPYLFKLAEKNKFIDPKITPLIEATTGNAGASFAWVARELGYRDVTVIIHEDAPKSRIEQIKSYGAKILFSPAGLYTKGYVHLLEKVLRHDKKLRGGKLGSNLKRLYAVTKIAGEARMPYYKLVDEAQKQLPSYHETKLDYFISIVGSGDFISGVGERLKQIYPHIIIVAIEPSESPGLSALKKGGVLNQKKMPHGIFGAIPFGLPKEKLNINFETIDQIQQVKTSEWKESIQLLRSLENKNVGRSSGAELAVALRLAQTIKNKNILITFHDPSWKYENNYNPSNFKV